jgi:hypothetical protein
LGQFNFKGISAFVRLIAGRNTGYGMADKWSTMQDSSWRLNLVLDDAKGCLPKECAASPPEQLPSPARYSKNEDTSGRCDYEGVHGEPFRAFRDGTGIFVAKRIHCGTIGD